MLVGLKMWKNKSGILFSCLCCIRNCFHLGCASTLVFFCLAPWPQEQEKVVFQMLAEIDGLNDSSQDFFIIGVSNRPDLIDPELLWPGRFDKLLYVEVTSMHLIGSRSLKALTRKFKLHPDISLNSIQKCPPNFTVADMYALCAEA
ncbi:Peroxisome biogenesis protein 6 [Quillaja saponaria]|uniref:Peroxisome biogenesis protein 6 n=1 Tax=Quillaja saponaria TaxID=32244 RepID=A0AAD7Q9X0_QUISA|nr:Peroxisome biogenesis protein 6 [Quillaja saponaria]